MVDPTPKDGGNVQQNLFNLVHFMADMRQIMLVGFGVGLLGVFMTVVRLAVAEHGWAKSWDTTSTRRSRRARAAVPAAVARPEPIRSKVIAVTLRTRLGDTAPHPGPT
jgi:hypothetical protein